MIRLPDQFRRGGFDYRIVRRHEQVVLLAKTRPGWKGREMFEVGKLHTYRARTFPNGQTVPAHEAPPADEDFGRSALDFAWNREQAEAGFASLTTMASQRTESPCIGVLVAAPVS